MPALFRAESARLTLAVSPLPLVLEHVGSTAVRGLVAKPVLDILAGYRDSTLRQACISSISAAGYLYRGEQGIPGRDFFRRGDPRAYHLHLAEVNSPFWHEHLAFRDLLRSDPAVQVAYGSLKQQLALQYPLDRGAYIEAKGPFVQEALRRARRDSTGTPTGR